MPLNKHELDLFYAISTIWTPRDQRFQATIGFEFELCTKAFDTLHELASGEINTYESKWQIPPGQAALAAIMARTFVDLATRAQKFIRSYLATGFYKQQAEEFYAANRALFGLRDAFQHADERIDDEPSSDAFQPLCGDVSWSVLTEIPSLDVYWVAYGPLVGEQVASPAIDMSTFKQRNLNHIWIRAHDIQVDAIETFANLRALVSRAHDKLSNQFNVELGKIGVLRDSSDDVRLPSQPNGRLRVEGIEIKGGAAST